MTEEKSTEEIFEQEDASLTRKDEKLSFPFLLLRHLDRISHLLTKNHPSDIHESYLRSARLLSTILTPYKNKEFNEKHNEIFRERTASLKKCTTPYELGQNARGINFRASEKLIDCCMQLIMEKGLIPEDYGK